jgi:hypothetical protein
MMATSEWVEGEQKSRRLVFSQRIQENNTTPAQAGNVADLAHAAF